jgi:hypothetical protein
MIQNGRRRRRKRKRIQILKKLVKVDGYTCDEILNPEMKGGSNTFPYIKHCTKKLFINHAEYMYSAK